MAIFITNPVDDFENSSAWVISKLYLRKPYLYLYYPILQEDIIAIFRWWQVPYFWAGLKMYDLVAGKKLVKSSYFVNKEKALDMFPMIKSDNLRGAIIYYDGMSFHSK